MINDAVKAVYRRVLNEATPQQYKFLETNMWADTLEWFFKDAMLIQLITTNEFEAIKHIIHSKEDETGEYTQSRSC
jgi:hypothetical protein